MTDQLGNKITDEGLADYIQQVSYTHTSSQITQISVSVYKYALDTDDTCACVTLQEMCANRRVKAEVQTSIGRDVRPWHVSTDQTAIEITGRDRPGLMSEITAALAELECNISAAVAWTHNTRVACILYVEDGPSRIPVTDPCRLSRIQSQIENVVRAHHCEGERRSVSLAVPTPSLTHTERRLHQLMAADIDHEMLFPGSDGVKYWCGSSSNHYEETKVTIENCNEKGYSTVTVSSRDRPKLLFDTVCALTDMQYVVFHAAVSSHSSTAIQVIFMHITTFPGYSNFGQLLEIKLLLWLV